MSVNTPNGNMVNNDLGTGAEYHLPSFLRLGAMESPGGRFEEQFCIKLEAWAGLSDLLNKQIFKKTQRVKSDRQVAGPRCVLSWRREETKKEA